MEWPICRSRLHMESAADVVHLDCQINQKRLEIVNQVMLLWTIGLTFVFAQFPKTTWRWLRRTLWSWTAWVVCGTPLLMESTVIMTGIAATRAIKLTMGTLASHYPSLSMPRPCGKLARLIVCTGHVGDKALFAAIGSALDALSFSLLLKVDVIWREEQPAYLIILFICILAQCVISRYKCNIGHGEIKDCFPLWSDESCAFLEFWIGSCAK